MAEQAPKLSEIDGEMILYKITVDKAGNSDDPADQALYEGAANVARDRVNAALYNLEHPQEETPAPAQ